MLRCVSMALLLVVSTACAAEAKEKEALPEVLGLQMEPFALDDYRGKAWSYSEVAEAKVVVVAFLGVECPLVQLYAPRLMQLRSEYQQRGVEFVGINSNQQDSLAEMAHLVKHHKLEFPLLKDPGNRVADAFQAGRTPEIFVLDAQRRVRYHGRIDDQYTYGIQRPEVTHEYLKEALEALLAGREVAIPQTQAVGCHIGRKLEADESSPVTYSNQIARIFQKRCVECHREGAIGPFTLTSYEASVGWAEMVAEVVHEERMPPWHASEEHGHFINNARLTTEEKQLIYDWVDAGAPQGDPAELPPPREFPVGWRIGTPDQIVTMPKEFHVPATGEVRYQYFVVDPGFTEDKWIQAAECRPGNPAVVHHIIVAVVGDKLRRQAHGDLSSEWLAATAPGARPMQLPEGRAKFVPAGSKLAFQLHYTPNGAAQTDRSSIGLKFAEPGTVKQEVFTRNVATHNFVIPPGAESHKVKAESTLQHNTTLLAMFPHMHLRGKAFRYTAHYPNGTSEILLDVPHYDFNWQNSYILAEPKLLPKGTRLLCEAQFDNSEENLANPDPTASVRWGDQTWEEMMIGYYDMVLTDQDLTQQATATRTEAFLAQAKQQPPKLTAELTDQLAAAVKSDDSMTELLLMLRQTAPQLDRLCVTIVADDDTMHIARVAQEFRLGKQVGGAGAKLPARGWSLPKYAKGSTTVVNTNLSNVRTPEFKFMSLALHSSMHVPVTIGGKPATINFWSAEVEAFPPAAVSFLEAVAKAAEAAAE